MANNSLTPNKNRVQCKKLGDEYLTLRHLSLKRNILKAWTCFVLKVLNEQSALGLLITPYIVRICLIRSMEKEIEKIKSLVFKNSVRVKVGKNLLTRRLQTTTDFILYTVKKAVELLDVPSRNTFLMQNKFNSTVEILYF